MPDRFINAHWKLKRDDGNQAQAWGFESGRLTAQIVNGEIVRGRDGGCALVESDGSARILDTIHNRKMLKALVGCGQWVVEDEKIFEGLDALEVEDPEEEVVPVKKVREPRERKPMELLEPDVAQG